MEIGLPAAGALVGAKLRPPRPLRPLVDRPELRERLSHVAADAVLVLVHGPSGIGKTSLLTGWADAEPRPVGWLTVDARDNDPARFWSHVAGALALAVPDAGGGAPVGSDQFVSALADQVGPAATPPATGTPDRGGGGTPGAGGIARPVLVLDEYEHLTDPALHTQVDLFVRACGERLTIVVAGRSRPPLRLDRLTLAGRLATFTWPDLRMTADEADLLLRTGFDLRLPPDRLTALVRSTDGWAGGLALAGAGLRTHPVDAVAPPAGDEPDEAVADHLLAQVWAGLAPELREFLLDTAVLDRFSIPLAEAVHPRRSGGQRRAGHPADAADLLERLRLDGTFLLREEDGWFRYQRLFRWALARRLAAADPERARAAHRAAGRWHARHGNREDAIDHALNAGDHADAAGLIAGAFESCVADGRIGTLERWLQALPDSVVVTGNDQLVRRGLDLWCLLGRSDERDRWSGLRAGGAGPDGPADVWRLCLPRERGDLAQALRQGREVAARTGPGWTSPLTVTQARISTGRSLVLAGQPAECARLLAGLEDRWPEGIPALLAVSVHALRGLAAYLEKDLDRARGHATRAAGAWASCQVPPRLRAVPEYVVLRAALSAPGDDPAAVRRLRALVENSPGLAPDHTMTVFALLILARTDLDRGDAAAAADRVAAADALLTTFPSPLGLVDLRDELIVSGGTARPAELLSARELAVLQYLRSDLTLAEIAGHLYVSVNTVKTHARHVYRKLGVAGRHRLPSPGDPA